MFYRAGLILCLGAALVSAETGCPYPEDVYPCQCENRWGSTFLTCHKVHDTQVLLRVFKNSRRYSFSEFRLMESSLQYIPHQIFDDVKVRKWNMTNVTLRNLFDEVPRDPLLYQLHAMGLKILGGLDWKKLAVFKYLDQLYLWDMNLRKMPAASFSNVNQNLQYLRCSNCQIKQLDEYLFKDFSSLRYIILPNNAIVHIKRNMFPIDSYQLNIIDLQNNNISTLPSDIFSEMPRLLSVYLNGNRISVLPEASFQNLILKYQYRINVTENPIRCDCQIAWVLDENEKKARIQGNCYEPKALRDKSFNQLTRVDIRCEMSSNSIL